MDQQLRTLVAVAKEFQKARPSRVRAAMQQLLRQNPHQSILEAGENPARLMLLLRVMFDLPDGRMILPPFWMTDPPTRDAGMGDAGWPIVVRDGRLKFGARLLGCQGLIYDPIAEYNSFQSQFAFRNLDKLSPR